jgi:ornithine cyclodeaminase/alanine dehydrogenase-like protein (mu-crystallin family)
LVSRKATVRYLSRADVEAVGLDMATVIELLEEVFKEKGEGRVEMPPKPGIHTMPDAFIHAMPAYIPAMAAAGVKWVSGYPENQAKGLPYISGLLILNDVSTGVPYAVMDCTWITAARTGAATAVAARRLARVDSESAGILACGVQGRANLTALAAVFRLKRVWAYDVVPEVQASFVRDMSTALELEVVGVEDPRSAVAQADIVVTSGPIHHQPHGPVQAGWTRPGVFASAVDFDTYWSADAIAEFDRIVTDDLDQFDYYAGLGYFKSTPRPGADLGDVVTGRKPGRTGQDERTMSMNLGLALDDMAVAPEVYRRAVKLGLGTELPL